MYPHDSYTFLGNVDCKQQTTVPQYVWATHRGYLVMWSSYRRHNRGMQENPESDQHYEILQSLYVYKKPCTRRVVWHWFSVLANRNRKTTKYKIPKWESMPWADFVSLKWRCASHSVKFIMNIKTVISVTWQF